MPYLPVFLLALLAVVNLFVVAFLLWLTCKICRVRRLNTTTDRSPETGVRFRRALAVIVFLSIGGILESLGLWFVHSQHSALDLPFSIASLALQVGLILVALRLFVCPTIGRTLLVALLFWVFGILYTVGFVLTVRSTLVHPYVVPTGSMAETLRGYHKEVACPICGCDFAVNCSMEADPGERQRPQTTFACVCPNCRQSIYFPSAPPSYREDYPASMQITDPGIVSGDRFFSGRGLLGAEKIAPRRFDLFAHEFRAGKQTMEYIKRIVGLPGETIAIKGGDLYALAADKGLSFDDAVAMRDIKDTMEGRRFTHENDEDAIERFKKGEFEILRKGPEQILALRHLVYDDDHRAKDQPARWTSDNGWKAAGNRHRSDSTEGVAWLRYRHLLPDNDGKAALIADFAAYNAYQNSFHPPLRDNNWVGDLLLECEVVLDNPQGELTLELSKGEDRFRAWWDLSTGVCTLLRLTNEGEQSLESKPTAMSKKGSYRLRFANVDERLVIWVNDDLPFGDGVAYSPPKQAGPTAKNDLEPVGVGVRAAEVEIGPIRLFRDVYYTAGDNPTAPDVPNVSWTDPESWNDLRRPPVRTFYVQPGHYFLLGDNSPESSDSRSYGSIPHRLLLGRAFFVYYPWKRVGPLR